MRTTKNTIAVIVASTLALGSVTTLMGADWPSFRGPNHDGRSPETITWPKDGPKQLWKINVGIGHSAVSVVGDRAYTMGNTDDIDTDLQHRRRHGQDRLEAFLPLQREGRHQELRRTLCDADRRQQERMIAPPVKLPIPFLFNLYTNPQEDENKPTLDTWVIGPGSNPDCNRR